MANISLTTGLMLATEGSSPRFITKVTNWQPWRRTWPSDMFCLVHMGLKKIRSFHIHIWISFFFPKWKTLENGKSSLPGFRHRCGNGARLKGVYCHFLTSSRSCYLTPSFKLIPGPSRLIWDSGLTWSGNGERIWHFLAPSAQMTYFRPVPIGLPQEGEK